jgi:putative transposase
MRGNAPINRAILKGCMPFTPMPSEPLPEVAVLPVKEWVRRKSLDATNENRLMRMSI